MRFGATRRTFKGLMQPLGILPNLKVLRTCLDLSLHALHEWCYKFGSDLASAAEKVGVKARGSRIHRSRNH